MTYLAKGMQTSSRTKLTTLDLCSVGIGDAGLISFGGAIESGALIKCSTLYLDWNHALHDITC